MILERTGRSPRESHPSSHQILLSWICILHCKISERVTCTLENFSPWLTAINHYQVHDIQSSCQCALHKTIMYDVFSFILFRFNWGDLMCDMVQFQNTFRESLKRLKLDDAVDECRSLFQPLTQDWLLKLCTALTTRVIYKTL